MVDRDSFDRTPKQSFASLFLRNRHLLVLGILLILVSGLSSIFALPRLEDPRIVNRNPIIITPVPGASAERVETLVTKVLEDSLREIETIKDIESTSSAGVSVIAVELADSVTGSENQEIFSEIRDEIAEARPLLPPQALEPMIDDKRDPAAFTLIMGLNWSGPGKPELGVMNRLAKDLADRLRNVRGTEIVRLYGAPDEEITVTVDQGELAELSLDGASLARQIAASDAKTPAGVLRGRVSDVAIEVDGELSDVARIAEIPIATGQAGQSLTLGSIAEVERGWRKPATEMAFADGDRSIFVAVRMGNSSRVDLWATEANAAVDQFASEVGSGIVVDRIFEQEKYTSGQLGELVSNLIAGAIVVILVVLVMMGWRLAIIIGLALPLVVSMVLFGLQLMGNAIHQMSIFGIIIALGLLIDNAIVMADEVTKHKAQGKSATQAVEAAVGHLFIPLFASTLTTVLAFAPIMLLPGSAGDFVSSIGQSVILALISSFIVAVTITAALAGLFAKPAPADAQKSLWRDGISLPLISEYYKAGLDLGLRKPALAILASVTLPLSGFAAMTSLGNDFFPPVDRDMFTVEIWMPSGSSVKNTASQAEQIEAAIREIEQPERVFWLVGGSFPTVYYNLVMNKDNAAYYAQAIVKASSNEEAKRMIAPLQAELDARFPEAQIVIGQFGQGPPVAADIEYRVFGPDVERLQAIGDELRLAMQSHHEILHTQASMDRGSPKLWFNADEEEAQLAKLSLSDLSRQFQNNYEGGVGGFVIEQLEQLPVRVRYDDGLRGNLSAVASSVFVSSGTDRWVPAEAIGDFELRPELTAITRFDTERTNIVRGFTANGALPITIANDVLEQLEAEGFALPSGYRIELGGAVEVDSAARGNLLVYAPILLTLTIATLVLLFRSAAIAGVLGTVAFLSIGLGMLSTWAIGFPISFNTILGTLGLIGLAFNNSIVVLAALKANPNAARGEPEAIVAAIMDTSRHIVSTTLTTIGGFLPLLLIVGGDFWPSLAIVLAGGVSGSMILALLFVPAVYLLLQKRRGAQEPGTISQAEPEGKLV
ncbi:efflux RND transporter permease subunit [Sphingorhabdus sp. Alg231-15]|uniref:efflux RND transporter permease subunit n=1 Tax=Sphingorhabdus sp. Alg231-15 TaxID=1922222 RepID=UPI000D55DC2D